VGIAENTLKTQILRQLFQTVAYQPRVLELLLTLVRNGPRPDWYRLRFVGLFFFLFDAVPTKQTRFASIAVPSPAHLQWLCVCEYRHLVESEAFVHSKGTASEGDETALSPAVLGEIEMRLLLDAIYGKELRALAYDSMPYKTLRDLLHEMVVYHQQIDSSEQNQQAKHSDLSDDAIRKITESFVRQPLLGTRRRSIPASNSSFIPKARSSLRGCRGVTSLRLPKPPSPSSARLSTSSATACTRKSTSTR